MLLNNKDTIMRVLDIKLMVQVPKKIHIPLEVQSGPTFSRGSKNRSEKVINQNHCLAYLKQTLSGV